MPPTLWSPSTTPADALDDTRAAALGALVAKIDEGRYALHAPPCLLCGGDDLVPVTERERHGLPMPLAICRACGLPQLRPRLADADYVTFYQEDYGTLYKSGRPDRAFAKQERRGTAILRFLAEQDVVLPHPARVFEVGANAGGILSRLASEGHDVAGCDLDPTFVAHGRTRGVDLREGDLADVELPWVPDLFVLSHVLEHLVDPRASLAVLRERCGPDTLVYVEVPGFRQQLVVDGLLPHLHVAHITYFDLTLLTTLMEGCGFALIAGDEHVRSLWRVAEPRPRTGPGAFEETHRFVLRHRDGTRLGELRKRARAQLGRVKRSRLVRRLRGLPPV